MGQKTWPPVLGGLAGLLNLPSMREPVCSAAPTLRPGGKKAFKLSSNSWVRAACGVLEDPVRELLPQGSTWPGYRDPCGSNSLASRSWGQLLAWLDALPPPPPPPPPPTSLSPLRGGSQCAQRLLTYQRRKASKPGVLKAHPVLPLARARRGLAPGTCVWVRNPGFQDWGVLKTC